MLPHNGIKPTDILRCQWANPLLCGLPGRPLQREGLVPSAPEPSISSTLLRALPGSPSQGRQTIQSYGEGVGGA
jgi:hypothetical protein